MGWGMPGRRSTDDCSSRDRNRRGGSWVEAASEGEIVVDMWRREIIWTESGPGCPTDPPMVQLTLSAQGGRIIVWVSQTTDEVAGSDSLSAMKSIQVIVTGRARQLPGPRVCRSAGVAGVTAAKGSAAEKRDCSGRLRFVRLHGRRHESGQNHRQLGIRFVKEHSGRSKPVLKNESTLPGAGGFSSRDFQSGLMSLFACRGKSRLSTSSGYTRDQRRNLLNV